MKIVRLTVGALRGPIWAVVLAALLLQAACVSIPPESVTLSKQIGADIHAGRSAHLSTLDAFYERLQADNDEWVTKVYLPRAVANLKADLDTACRQKGDKSADCAALSESDIVGLVKNTIDMRDEMQRALSNNRNEVVRLVTEHYALLAAANAGVTSLLASAVDVKDATRQLAAVSAESTGLEIDLDAIARAFDDVLARADGEEIADLEKELAEILASVKH